MISQVSRSKSRMLSSSPILFYLRVTIIKLGAKGRKKQQINKAGLIILLRKEFQMTLWTHAIAHKKANEKPIVFLTKNAY